MRRIWVAAALGCLSISANAQTYLIENVRIFNGVDEALTLGHVLVEDGIISTVSSDPIALPDGGERIDGDNRVLTPGFIDLHVHLTLHEPWEHAGSHSTVVGAIANDVARHFLNSGFTTVRDAGGTHPHLAQAIDAGLIYGPRVFPSGATLTQTAGHGDARHRDSLHPFLHGGSPYENADRGVIVDGVDQHLAATRENLRHGATQIKIMGGGGVMSDYDPIWSLQPTPEEIRAVVQAAADFDTYVLAHAYTSEAIRRLVENGVRCIEHGLLIDDATAKMVKENDVAISTQLVVYRELANLPGINETNLAKLKIVLDGQENLIELIKKYDITTGFATDLIGGMYPMLTREFTERAMYWTPVEVLHQATAQSAEVIRMSGRLNRHGNFGEIREGWVADILLHNGNPLEDIAVLRDPESNLALIMKGGQVMKSAL